MITRRSFFAGLMAGGAAAARWRAEAVEPIARLQGDASLLGSPPPEIPVDLTNFPECRAIAPNPLTTRHYIVGAEGALANVFVHVADGLPPGDRTPPSEPVLLDQRRCGFHPYVLGMQVGQIVRIRNSEPYLETVHALPKINREFNIAQPVTGMVNEVRFDHPEVLIKVKCEIHPWEFAFIGVVDHPFFAVTDSQGRFALPPGLPPGRYRLAATHPKAGTQTVDVTLAPGETKSVRFEFKPHTAPSSPA